MGKRQYRVYVIELSKKVFNENARFRKANPQYNGILECLYIGMTSKSPQERFLQHKEKLLSKKGISISSSLVRKYGLYLRPSMYKHLPLFNKSEAIEMEIKLGHELRRKRYAVWYN